MKRTMILVLSLSVLSLAVGITSAWTLQWKYDPASIDYYQLWEAWNVTSNHKLQYHQSSQPVAADTVSNGPGVLEVYVASGVTHNAEPPYENTIGSIHCINGATGEVIWRELDPDIYTQCRLELIDMHGDETWELYQADFTGCKLRDASTGAILWCHNWTTNPEWLRPGTTNGGLRIDKNTVIIKDPRLGLDYGKVFIYQRCMDENMYKRDATTGDAVAISTAIGAPCFGGSSAADMNNDGIPEIIESSYYGGGMRCMDLDMNILWQETQSWVSACVPVLVDINNDGYLDVITQPASSSNCQIGVIDGYASLHNGGTAVYMAGKGLTNTGGSGHNAPAVYDIDGDGHLEATGSWSSAGYIWDITNWASESGVWPNYPTLTMDYGQTIANVYGDSSHLELMDGAKIYDYTGTLVYTIDSSWGGGTTPCLVADVDGDGKNEVIQDGSRSFSGIPSTPWGTGIVWTSGWYQCWENSDAVALNTRQEILSQYFSVRRTSSEIPIVEYLWKFGDEPPPPEPAVTVLSPNGGENFETGQTSSIFWSSNFDDDISIELCKNGVVIGMIYSGENTGDIQWIIPAVTPDDDYTIKITNTVVPTVFDYSDGDFTIVAPPEPEDKRCWRCNGSDSEYFDFTYGTICGQGEAVNYPYNSQPTCFVAPPESTPGFELIILFIGIAFAILVFRRRKDRNEK